MNFIHSLLPPIVLALLGVTLMLLDVHSVVAPVVNASGFALAIGLLFAYGSGYLLYRIVNLYNEYRANREYQ